MSKKYFNDDRKEFLLPDKVVEILERANERDIAGEVTEEELEYLEKNMEVDFIHFGYDSYYGKNYQIHSIYNKRKDPYEEPEWIENVYLFEDV